MPSSSPRHHQPRQQAEQLLRAWRAHSWLNETAIDSDREACLLRRSLAEIRDELPVGIRAALEKLTSAGICLRNHWPRPWKTSTWVGSRLFLGPAKLFQADHQFASIVCSQLGRDHQNVRRWPELLDCALRTMAQHDVQPLILPNSTLATATAEYCQPTSLLPVVVDLPSKGRDSLVAWLADCIAPAVPSVTASISKLRISPKVGSKNVDRPSLQDAFAMCLADQIYALWVRDRGRIESLINQRLQQVEFGPGSVFLFLNRNPHGVTGRATRNLTPRNMDWLDQGVVGWYVPSRSRTNDLAGCHNQGSTSFTQQIVAPIAALPNESEGWPFLTHCTRGAARQHPDEDQATYRRRLRIEGEAAEAHPLLSLHRICRERSIRASARWIRTAQNIVSFSDVPLPNLLARRSFRSHLGRWDWEPYGLFVNRTLLHALGARPVQYGSETDFHRLPEEAKPLFQPVGKQQIWSQEGEWRILQDFDFSGIDPAAVRLFTKTRLEAFALARIYPWSIFWWE